MVEDPIISLKNVSVTFCGNEKNVTAIDHVSFDIQKGDVFGIIGYSGAGKSTLARTINFLQRPTQGQIIVNGQSLIDLSAAQLRNSRKKIGMIFQHFNLMNTRTVEENITLPLLHSGLSKVAQREKAERLLKLVGLANKKMSYPRQLSGGQKQRVAIARSLANDPEILISDEATSALDPKTTEDILTILKKLNTELHLTIIMISHEMEVIKSTCNKVVVLNQGKVVENGSILDLFLHPKEVLTQTFIGFGHQNNDVIQSLDLRPKETVIEVTFINSPNEDQAKIVEIIAVLGVPMRIFYSNSQFIQQRVITNLILGIQGNKEQVAKVLRQLKSHRYNYQLTGGGRSY
ncbi:methionine ABC transporter ATP-binding protein [Loigolactobacillus backii]|uniref:methionine ABC transporter ATP-binding protein n=1 Tax=Loigolactobacillus backii TaxID=375175 RepID=UPI000837AC91|nr:methionine ABC transporter ATP-binding protein [Loigolactobacillus backii]PIO86841.1 hypothetical protein B8A32_06635 [Loigolactobacillus backii]